MRILRTPDSCFSSVPDFPYAPRRISVGDSLEMAWVEDGPATAAPVLCLHGEPSWSFLYRKLIPVISGAGHRVVAPDLIGFGRSDKPSERADYTYQRHMDWLTTFVEKLDLKNITLVCQDWGGLLGLRLVAEHPERFARVVAANTFLPTGDIPMPRAFFKWREFSQTSPDFDIGRIVSNGCAAPLSPEVKAAYDAPFPDDSYKAGARQFPALVPATPEDPATPANRLAWERLAEFKKPLLTAFSDLDPITRGADAFLQMAIPGAQGQAHTTLTGGGHFLQEDVGEALANVVVGFMAATA